MQDMQGGFRVRQWCALVGISRSGFYTLNEKPKTVKLGRRTIVVECPGDYLERISKAKPKAKADYSHLQQPY